MKTLLKTSLMITAAALTLLSGAQAFSGPRVTSTESSDSVPGFSTLSSEPEQNDYCETLCEEQQPATYLQCVDRCHEFLANIIKSDKSSKLTTIVNLKDS